MVKGAILAFGPLVCFIAILLGIAIWGDAQVLDLLLRTQALILLALSWSLAASAGLISLGQTAFWGVGAYLGAFSANVLGVPMLAALPIATLGGALLGTVLALITGRLRGIFFAICTLAVAEGLRVVALMLPNLTGGATGLFLVQEQRPSPQVVCLAGIVCVAIAVSITLHLFRSKFFYATRAMRSSEPTSQMLGVDPRFYRICTLAIGGGMAGCAGSLSFFYSGYLDPGVAFSLGVTIQSQIAPVLGGVYSAAGPIIGSIAVVGLSEATRLLVGGRAGLSLLMFGLILIFSVLFLPRGLYGEVNATIQRWLTRRRSDA
jgi:branched-chain amino acid transport system permease protein